MAKLIKCKGCGAQVSKKAKACPQCGEPVPKGTSSFTWIVVILILLIIILPKTTTDTSSKTSSSSSTSSSSTDESYTKWKKIHEEKIKKEQLAVDTKYFKQSKETIIKDLNLSMQNKDYNRVIYKTAKYLSFKGKDDDIIKMNAEATALMEADKLAKIKLANEKHEKEILKQLKKIPTSNFKKNQELYKILLSYKPNNKKYQEKVRFYTEKVEKEKAKEIERQKKEEKERQDRIARFGKPPVASAWDGTYHVVERYLKRVANDPDSIEVDSCTRVHYTKHGWLVGCDYRGRNAFGGMIRKSNWFTIRHDTVISVDEASAY